MERQNIQFLEEICYERRACQEVEEGGLQTFSAEKRGEGDDAENGNEEKKSNLNLDLTEEEGEKVSEKLNNLMKKLVTLVKMLATSENIFAVRKTFGN